MGARGRRFKSGQPDLSGPEIQWISGPESVRDLINHPETLHFAPARGAQARRRSSWCLLLLDVPGRYGAGRAPDGYEHPRDGIERAGTVAKRRRTRRVLGRARADDLRLAPRSEEHTSELQSIMRITYAVFCLKKKNK